MKSKPSNRFVRNFSATRIFSVAVLLCSPGIALAQNTWVGDTSGNWSDVNQWNPVAPVAGPTGTAILGDVTTGTRTITFDTGAPGTVATLQFDQSSAAVNELLFLKTATVTNAITLGAVAGTERITFVPPLTQKLPGDNQDNDSLTNLQEFAFGTQPTVSTGEIVYSGGTLTTPGAPKIVAAAGTYSMVFGRRADYVAAGLTYTVEFSANLNTWADKHSSNNTPVPVQVATDGTINVMSVPYPDFITTTSGTQKPTFSRVKVVLAP